LTHWFEKEYNDPQTTGNKMEGVEMKAALLREQKKPLEIDDVRIDKPGPHEVLVRSVAAGVCHSDLHFVDGSYPMPVPAIPGHESAGVVEAVGADVTYVKPGDHVVAILTPFCGECEYCLSGHMSLCRMVNPTTGQRGAGQSPRLSTAEGKAIFQFGTIAAFAEQTLVHDHSIAKISPEMPMDRAALIGCAVVTGLGTIFHTVKVEPGATVVVIGCGGVGLMCINGAYIAGAARIIAVDVEQEKLKLAGVFGATDTVNAKDGDPVEKIMDLTGGSGVQYSIEAIGLKKTAEQAFRMLRPGGVATVIGMIPIGTNIEIHGPDLLRERRLQGTFMGSNRFRTDFPRFIDYYLQGRLKLDELISDRIRLEDVNAALDNLKQHKGTVARQVIMFD
jgi:S-(hydroxymethyl)glutathione dehydrogenase/alcohol dehydrogenase